jgi:hypothetical protein
MKRHLSKKIKCYRIIDSYKVKDDELEELSLIPILFSDLKKINNVKEENDVKDIIQNFDNINDYIVYIDQFNKTNCIYCNKVFFRKYELKRHLLTSCKKKCIEEHIHKNIENNTSDKHNIIINNNQQINNQQINNIQINLFNENIINSFDNDWDISNIDLQKKILLFLADNKYSKTMEEILKNNKNLNVLFDKCSDTGLVYKNNIDKFINIKSDDIIISIIYKLYTHLISFYEDIKNNDFIKDLDIHKDKIEEKYTDFNNQHNKNIKTYVKNILIDIFDKYKDKITEQFIEFEKYILTEKEQGF